MPDALGMFAWSLHSVLTHEIRFTGSDTATGRVHLFNRNGLEWNGRPELFDVGGRYLDEYRRTGDTWRFSRRVEETLYVTGGEFAAVVRDLAARHRARPPGTRWADASARALPTSSGDRPGDRTIVWQPSGMTAVGIDACARGWIAAAIADDATVSVHYLPTIDAVTSEIPSATGIAIDIPIGLPTTSPRTADIEARNSSAGAGAPSS